MRVNLYNLHFPSSHFSKKKRVFHPFTFPLLIKHYEGKLKEQNLATKLVVALGYNLTQYLFIGGEF